VPVACLEGASREHQEDGAPGQSRPKRRHEPSSSPGRSSTGSTAAGASVARRRRLLSLPWRL